MSSADQELATVDWDPPQYSRIGSVEGKYTVERKPVFAVVEVGATQFKVSPDDLVYSEKLKGVTVNDKLALMRVLMLGTTAETVIGRPFIPDARVTAAVEVRKTMPGLSAAACWSSTAAACFKQMLACTK